MQQNLKTVELSQYLSAADELIEEARNGRMFILVDDEDRENEGDLVVPAQFATPDAMRGRVSAVSTLFISASNELGGFESGVTAALFGTVPAVILGGVGTLIVVAVWMRVFPPLRTVDRMRDVMPGGALSPEAG